MCDINLFKLLESFYIMRLFLCVCVCFQPAPSAFFFSYIYNNCFSCNRTIINHQKNVPFISTFDFNIFKICIIHSHNSLQCLSHRARLFFPWLELVPNQVAEKEKKNIVQQIEMEPYFFTCVSHD